MDSVHDDPYGPGSPIRISSDQSSLSAPRGFSQSATSFIAFTRQGIHQMPFIHLRENHPCARVTPHLTDTQLLPQSYFRHVLCQKNSSSEQPSPIRPNHPENIHRSTMSNNPTTEPQPRRLNLFTFNDPPKPATSWWRRSGSNRRPPACKAGALPTELRPRSASLRPCWWARVDSNYRPHAYQACALTN